jgi:hypothetical protein
MPMIPTVIDLSILNTVLGHSWAGCFEKRVNRRRGLQMSVASEQTKHQQAGAAAFRLILDGMVKIVFELRI